MSVTTHSFFIVFQYKEVIRMTRSKNRGRYRITKAINELTILADSIESIEDADDKREAILQIAEIKWLIQEGLNDFREGI